MPIYLTKLSAVGIALAGQLRLEFNSSQAFARRPVEDQMIATGNHLLPANRPRFAAVFSEALKLIRQRTKVPLVPRFTGAAGPVFATQGLVRSRAGAKSRALFFAPRQPTRLADQPRVDLVVIADSCYRLQLCKPPDAEWCHVFNLPWGCSPLVAFNAHEMLREAVKNAY